MLYAHKIKEGNYRGVLMLDETNHIELPFNFNFKYINKKPIITIQNADEKIIVNEVSLTHDSINFKMPVFDTEFSCKIVKNGIEGVWINHYRKEKNTIKFIATYNQDKRFLIDIIKSNSEFEGNWEVTFSPNTIGASKAVGQFHHVEQSNLIFGTFLTETGDYRYLEGVQSGNKLYLSSFDGSHAFLFDAELTTNNVLLGKFYSGSHWKEDWLAEKNEGFKLRAPDEITFVKNENNSINFSFHNLENQIISITDKKFENKAMLIQIMGSWCPNCMDESAYLAHLYNQFKNQGLEIVALAFEKTEDTLLSKKRLMRLKNRYNIEYEILNTGKIGKNKASEIFPMLNEIVAFPTLIFLNNQHKIIKVHTGFNGPATGKAFEAFQKTTEQLIQLLIK